MREPRFDDRSIERFRIGDEVDRRRFLLGAAAMGTFLVGCATSSSSAPSAGGTTTPGGSTSSAAGPWTFTDDRGESVSLPEPPGSFAAFSTSAAALAEFGVTPVGIMAWTELEEDPQLRFMDLTGIETLGTVWAEINLEKLALLDPDFVITVYDSGDDSMYNFKDAKHQRQIEQISPLIGIDGVQPLLDQIARYEELAISLGADVEAEAVATARDRFQAASDAVATAASDNPGIKVMAVYPGTDALLVSQVEITADLTYYESLGVEMVHAQGDGIFYWEELSWENADKYPVDLIMVDSRGVKGGSLEKAIEPLQDFPTWQALPAVQAGQLTAWHAFDPAGYRFYYEAMEELAPAIASAQVVA
jgi:iron complex transport system substrate-binding protein